MVVTPGVLPLGRNSSAYLVQRGLWTTEKLVGGSLRKRVAVHTMPAGVRNILVPACRRVHLFLQGPAAPRVHFSAAACWPTFVIASAPAI